MAGEQTPDLSTIEVRIGSLFPLGMDRQIALFVCADSLYDHTVMGNLSLGADLVWHQRKINENSEPLMYMTVDHLDKLSKDIGRILGEGQPAPSPAEPPETDHDYVCALETIVRKCLG